MAPPSNPKLMTRVLDAVVTLAEDKGSSARDVLDFIRHNSKTTSRNLTMQVYRALKHGVNAGLLRHRGGRYKAIFLLNRAPVKPSTNDRNADKSVEETTDYDEQANNRSSTTRRTANTEKRSKRTKQRRRSRSRANRRQRGSRSPRRKRNPGPQERIEESRRKPKHKEMKGDIGNPSPANRRTRNARPTERPYYSDVSESSEDESRHRKRKYPDQARRKTPVRQECKCETVVKPSRRSQSRNRSPQRQQQSHQEMQLKSSIDDADGHGIDSERHVDRNGTADQEIEKHREQNNSGSGSTL